jgi:hypothetical protein
MSPHNPPLKHAVSTRLDVKISREERAAFIQTAAKIVERPSFALASDRNIKVETEQDKLDKENAIKLWNEWQDEVVAVAMEICLAKLAFDEKLSKAAFTSIEDKPQGGSYRID